MTDRARALLEVTAEVAARIRKGETAGLSGARTLRQHGLEFARAGVSTMSEVLRVTPGDD